MINERNGIIKTNTINMEKDKLTEHERLIDFCSYFLKNLKRGHTIGYIVDEYCKEKSKFTSITPR